MAEDTATTDDAQAGDQTTEPEQTVPYSRFEQVNRKAKEAAAETAALRKETEQLRRAIEERESAGLPELDQMKKRAEKLEQERDQLARERDEATKAVQRSKRERMVQAAAQAQNFADPSDASAFVDLDSIEDERDAERAVKALAKQKAHLLKAAEPTLPGRVLENGRTTTPASPTAHMTEEAQLVSGALQEFLKNRNR